ncbi:MAG: hypothetical protein Q9163_005451 [Psora crenata]
MAEESQPAAISSAFPAPPPFYKTFTPENIARLQDHLESSSQGPQNTFNPINPVLASIPDDSSIPTDLRNLLPPPLPPDGTYRTFGVEHNIEPSLTPSLNPPPTPDHLLSLLRQILLKFLHITHILSIDPAMKFYGPAWDQLERLFKELHEGINAWRPYQARETLMRMMEDQIMEIKAESQRVREGIGKTKEVIEGIANSTEKDKGKKDWSFAEEEAREKKDTERGKNLWKLIERDVGVI